MAGNERIERRAIEAAIWGMPMVGVDAMRSAFFKNAGARYNDIVYFSKPADWKFQVATPNASSHYVYIQLNLREGPLVLEVPPAAGAGLFGSLNDAWQVPVTDVGPAGDDHGHGGKYVLLPPSYEPHIPSGHFPVQLNTYNGYSILRAIPATSSSADVAKALELVKKLRIYPLSRAARPSEQRYIDIAGKNFEGIVPFDDTFYDGLARMVNEEPARARDMVAMEQLRSIGIEKGKMFEPSAATRAILKRAIVEAHASCMEASTHVEPYWPNSHWGLPSYLRIGAKTGFTFENDGVLDFDDRAHMFFAACAPPRTLGAATFYLLEAKDASDAPLEGEKFYHLRVPSKVPAKQFWAVTVYDLETASFIRGAPKVELSSYQATEKNADGSVDVYFGPKPPDGRESSWIYTAPGKRWFAGCRFYGPASALYDKSWTMTDIEEIVR